MKKAEKRRILISGDAGGEIIVSEFDIDTNTGKLLKFTPLYRERAHKGWVVSLKHFRNLDIVISASHDCSITYSRT